MFLKRFIPVVLALLLIFVFSGCSSDEEKVDKVNGTGEEVVNGDIDIDVNDRADNYYIVVDEGSSLAIRETPGTGDADDVIERLDRNAMVEVVDKHNNSVEESNYIWWEVIIPGTGERGWAASDFLSETALPDTPVVEGTEPDSPEYEAGQFNPDNYIGTSRAEFMNKYGYPDRTEIKGGIEFNHYNNIEAIVCYSRWINKSTIIKIRRM